MNINKKAVLSQTCPCYAPWHFSQICIIRQYTHGSLLESPFVPSSTDCWAVRAKIRQKRPSPKIERALVTSYRPSIVTLPLSSCLSEILPLLCSIARQFFPPTLFFPKFLHVPLGVGDLWATKSERWDNCLCN